jgi:hypothetical protein
MITWGLILLIAGLVVAFFTSGIISAAGSLAALIGVILLIVGLVLYVAHRGHT